MQWKRKWLLYIAFILMLFLVTYGIMKLYPIYLFVLKTVGKIILPFVLSALISYLIYPLLNKLEKLHIHRTMGIIILFISFIFICLIVLYKSIPTIIQQLTELSEQLPNLIQIYNDFINQLYTSTSFLPEVFHDKITMIITGLEQSLNRRIDFILSQLMHVGDFVVFIIIIPVLVFYFLKDKQLILNWIGEIVPKNYQNKYRLLIKAVDDSLGNYIRGQFIIALIVFAITYLIYYLLDIEYALLLAVFMGVMNIVPYFGPIIGSIPVVFYALTVHYSLAIIVLVLNLIVQLIESSLLSPYILGKTTHLHPIFLILILMVGAKIGGIIGMVIAVPLLTIVREVLKVWQVNFTNKHQ